METKNLKELRELRSEQEAKADALLEEGKLEEGKDALEQIKELDARIAEVEAEIKKIKEESGSKDEPKKEEPVQEERSNNTQGETRMNFKPSIKENKESKEVRGFMDFLRSKGQVRDGITSLGGAEAVIPDDVVTTPVELPETVTDLKAYANVVKVPTAQGSYPILESATERMISVEELAKNPELAKPKFLDVNYKVLTYRGQIAVNL